MSFLFFGSQHCVLTCHCFKESFGGEVCRVRGFVGGLLVASANGQDSFFLEVRNLIIIGRVCRLVIAAESGNSVGNLVFATGTVIG